MQNRYENIPPLGHVRAVPATSGGIIKSSLMASAAALAVVTIVYLPAEYGRDPTGFGAVLGLTEMGQIKQQLYAEAAADAAGAPVVLDPAVMARLAAIEAQLAMITDVIGAPNVLAAAPAIETAPAVETVPAVETAQAAETAQAVKDAPAPDAVPDAASTDAWRDEGNYTLAPGEGIEVKLAMQEGETAQFEWTANGAVVNFDTHGDGSGQKISYEQGRSVEGQTGELTAAFTGNHGWFWRNRTDAPVTLTLRTKGAYSKVKE